MKTMMRSLYTAGIASMILSLSGCTSGAPQCADSDVQELVVDISVKEGKRQAGYASLLQGLKHSSSEEEKQDLQVMMDNIDKRYEGMSLTAIRTHESNDEIQKVTCKGQLLFSNQATFDISYTAQYTEDGQLFVEVYGL